MKWTVVDIETSGLDPHVHEPIEIGLVTNTGRFEEFSLTFDHDKADPKALEINGYDTREFPPALTHEIAMDLLEEIFHDPKMMFVASPAHFDEGFLAAWFRRNGRRPPWGHRNVIDLKSYACGKFGVTTPMKNSVIASVVGVPELEEGLAHRALYDAIWTRDIFRELIR